jgi:hypothetical protein
MLPGVLVVFFATAATALPDAMEPVIEIRSKKPLRPKNEILFLSLNLVSPAGNRAYVNSCWIRC